MHWSHPEGKVRAKNAVNFDRTFLFVGVVPRQLSKVKEKLSEMSLLDGL